MQLSYITQTTLSPNSWTHTSIVHELGYEPTMVLVTPKGGDLARVSFMVKDLNWLDITISCYNHESSNVSIGFWYSVSDQCTIRNQYHIH